MITCVLLLVPALVFPQTPHLKELKANVQRRINTYLDKEKKLGEYYSITDIGMSVYASPDKKKNGKAELFVPWEKLGIYYELLCSADPKKELKTLNEPGYKPSATCRQAGKNQDYRRADSSGALPLKNIVIALDPGHTAGSLESGKTEQKYIHIAADTLHHTPEVKLAEGHLTLGTALLLRQKLEAAGATVHLTHSTPDGTALGKTFEQWCREDLKHVLDSLVKCKHITAQQSLLYQTKADKRKLFFEVFRDLELQKRADLINSWQPDLTVIIHFNVDEKNTGWKKLSDKNFVMTFIGGGMLPHDLSKPEGRFEFLRLALTNDLDESEKLSARVVQSFSDVLKVPIATKNDAKYLKENCLTTPSPGVYCRNLILTRLIHGPLVYGETLYQDNRKEAIALMDEDRETEGIKTSKRTREIAEAYYKGILSYFKP
jgi:N-acetylmuramoyl-L-alanine amidase